MASNFDQIVCGIFREMGGRGDIDAIAEHVMHTHPDLYADKSFVAFKGVIRGALRKIDTDTGLPYALKAGDEYVQTVLLSLDEYRLVVADYLRRARGNRRLAQRLADECEQIHGVRLDVEAMNAESA